MANTVQMSYWTSILKLFFGGFGFPVELFGRPFGGVVTFFSAMLVLLSFCWIFVGVRVPAGGPMAGAGIPRHAFSCIWTQNRRVRVREVAFSRFPGYLLR